MSIFIRIARSDPTGRCAPPPRPGRSMTEQADDGKIAVSPAAGSEAPQILVVEDSPLIADDLALMLGELGAPGVTIALSAGEARIALRSRRFDLVLLDVSLGDARADALLPDLGATPVVLVTARLAEELPPELAGMPLVGKPVQPEDLAALVRRYTAIASGQSI